MDIIFAAPLSLSHTPSTRTTAKKHPFKTPESFGMATGASEARELRSGRSPSSPLLPTMKTQNTHATMTDTRFVVIVIRSVLSRLGARSIQRPIDAEKQIEARVVIMPLHSLARDLLLSQTIRGDFVMMTYLTALATRVSG
jgi:hypothetical protein